MATVNANSLENQSEQDQAQAQQEYDQASGANNAAEQQRALTYQGLGSAAQQSGAYSGTQARDLTKYTQGLNVSSAEFGDHRATMSKLGRSNDKTLQGVYGQVREVNAKYQAAYDAAKAGNYDQADALRAEGDSLTDQYGLNDSYANQAEGAKGLQFKSAGMFSPLTNQSAAQADLGSPTGMLVGQQVNEARQLQDPNSAASVRFREQLTGGALAAVDAAHDSAVRAQAAEERGAGRTARDAQLGRGGATSAVATAAVAARTSERFATMRANTEQQTGAAKAQIRSAAGQMYESFRTDFAKNAVGLASAWVNDQSGIRDSFRTLTSQMAMAHISDLTAMAQQKLAGAVSIRNTKIPGEMAAAQNTWVDSVIGVAGMVLGAYTGSGAAVAAGTDAATGG